MSDKLENTEHVMEDSESEAMEAIEEMTLEKKLKVLERYDPADHYLLGAYVDSKDTVSNWCLGHIVKVQNYHVNVHFDAWPTRWDEVILNLFS